MTRFTNKGFTKGATMSETIVVGGREANFSGSDGSWWYIHHGNGIHAEYFIRPGKWESYCGQAGFFESEAAAREFAAKFAEPAEVAGGGEPTRGNCPDCGGTGGYSPGYVIDGEVCGPDACGRCNGTGDVDPAPELAELRDQLQTVHRHVAEAIELLGVDTSVATGRIPDSWTLREECHAAAKKLAELRAEHIADVDCINTLTMEAAELRAENERLSKYCGFLEGGFHAAKALRESAERERDALREALAWCKREAHAQTAHPIHSRDDHACGWCEVYRTAKAALATQGATDAD
jgi:hypothetical protein